MTMKILFTVIATLFIIILIIIFSLGYVAKNKRETQGVSQTTIENVSIQWVGKIKA